MNVLQGTRKNCEHDRSGGPLWIVIALITACLLWALYPKTYTFSDPVAYLQLSHDFLNIGQWPLDHPFQHRIGLLASHWLSMAIFGVSTFGAYLPQIILFCVLITAVLQKVSTRVGRLYAFAALLLLLPQTLTVFPDLGTATFMFLGVLLLERREGALRGGLFALTAFCAFLFKLTAVFLIVPFCAVLLWDGARRKTRDASGKRFYTSALGCSALLLAVYLFACRTLTGNPLARLSSADSLGERHLWSMNSVMEIVSRLFVDPPAFFLGYMGGTILLALLGALLAFQGRDTDRVQAGYFVAGLAFFTFASVSFSSYNPLPLEDRMAAFLVPPAAVLAANCLPILAERMAKDRWARQTIHALFLLLAFHWPSVDLARGLHDVHLTRLHDVRERIASNMQADPTVRLFVAENRTPDMIDIHFGFDGPDPEHVIVCPETSRLSDADKAYVLVDHERVQFLAAAYGFRTCAGELQKMAREAGFKILEDSRWMFVARN